MLERAGHGGFCQRRSNDTGLLLMLAMPGHGLIDQGG